MTATKKAAEERLLDASLEQVFGREPRTLESVAPPPLLAVALLLLGVGVVVAVAWLRSESTPVPLQDVAVPPLPPEVFAPDAAALARLPQDTENITVRLIGPAELNQLLHLPRVRRLQVLEQPVPESSGPPAPWHSAAVAEDSSALLPIGQLPALEELHLPFTMAVRPQHLKPLRGLLRLRDLALVSDEAGATLGRAVAELRALRTLRLWATEVDVGLLAALPARSLRGLELRACPITSADCWPALAKLRQLRRLTITSQNDGSVSVAGVTHHLGTLTEPAFAAFAALPELRELLLDESHFAGQLLERLPASLELLDLGDRPMNEAEAAALRRLTALRDLTFGCGLDAQSAAATLGALTLRRLDYRGRELTPDLLRAIAAQQDLVELALSVATPTTDLTPLTSTPRLEELQVRAWSRGRFRAPHEAPSVEQIETLSACRCLRRLVLVDCGLDTAKLQAQLPGVSIRAVEHL